MRTLLITLAAYLTALSQAAVEISDNLPPTPADYLTDALLATDGSIWITSEGKGVYRLDPSADDKRDTTAWFDASYFQGLPDTVNYYAITEDKQGRIWAGTDNKGVAVFNGQSWKTYDRENALLGERVFDIAVCPATGHVAVATSGGLNIYLPDTGQWLDLTRADGLVEDQIQSLCYDGRGNLWAAYQCGGVSRLSQRDNYKNTQTDQAPWYWDKENRVRQPLDGAGKGLPSNLCNAIHASPGGTVLVGTNSGLAWQTSGNNGWNYLRGKDYEAKNKGLWDVKVEPSSIRKPSLPLLSEDYITDIAETKEGYWIGYRQQGASLVDRNMKQIREGKFPDRMKTKYVTSLLTLPGGGVYAATYGHGLVKISDGSNRNRLPVVQQPSHPKHPSEAAVKTIEQLTAAIEAAAPPSTAPKAMYCRDDWATQGNWCERYGMHHALLCGTHGKFSDEMYSFPNKTKIEGRLGGHMNPGVLRIRNYNDDASENINVLFNPCTGTRVSTQWIDRGEDYPVHMDGPDLWAVIKVPEGISEVDLYFYNYDGHDLNKGANRDYLLEIRKYDSPLPEKVTFDLAPLSDFPDLPADCREQETRDILKTPAQARARVCWFAGSGVHKTFMVMEPGIYYIRMARNYSPSTVCNGVFITCKNTDGSISEREILMSRYGSANPQPVKVTPGDQKKHNALIKIWDGAALANTAPSLSKHAQLRLELYRLAAKQSGDGSLIDNWRWHAKLWSKQEQMEFEKLMAQCWENNQNRNPLFRSAEFFPYSPHVIPLTADECDIIEYMGIDWKQYLPDSKTAPVISIMELKEKIASLSKRDIEQLREKYINRLSREEKQINNIP